MDELAEHFSEEHRLGVQPSINEYVQRHPELESQIRDLFLALMVMEDLGTADHETDGIHHGETASELTVPERIDGYKIMREIGRGGLGIVHLAVQRSLSRQVTLKVLSLYAAMDASLRERFYREDRAAAKLDHPNIVPVYDIGEHENRPYFSIKNSKTRRCRRGCSMDRYLQTS